MSYFQTSREGLTLSIDPLYSLPHFSFADVAITIFVENSKSRMLLKP